MARKRKTEKNTEQTPTKTIPGYVPDANTSKKNSKSPSVQKSSSTSTSISESIDKAKEESHVPVTSTKQTGSTVTNDDYYAGNLGEDQNASYKASHKTPPKQRDDGHPSKENRNIASGNSHYRSNEKKGKSDNYSSSQQSRENAREDQRSTFDRDRNKRSDNYSSSSQWTPENAREDQRSTFDRDRNKRSDNYSSSSQWTENAREDQRSTFNRDRNRFEKEFRKFIDSRQPSLDGVTFKKVNEIEEDLFQTPEEYSLAHCVAEDMNMGSGIAVTFRQNFKQVDELLDQRQKTGGMAVLKDKNRHIYYLVTKRVSNGKPTLQDLFSSLCVMREHVRSNGVTKIAAPRIGCGLDRLEWVDVKQMLEFIFKDEDVEILICNFQQADSNSNPQYKPRKCEVVNVSYPIVDIEKGTIIIYFGSADGAITDEINALNTKFGILHEYKSAQRTPGSAVVSTAQNEDYRLYGCIVRDRERDEFGFQLFQKCIETIQRENRKLRYNFVGISAFLEGGSRGTLLLSKVVNLLKNSLTNVSVYVCWPEEIRSCMPYGDRSSVY